MERRHVLRAAVAGTGSVALGFTMTRSSIAAPAEVGPSSYGDLLPADENGLMLPEGFTARVIARTAQYVPGTDYLWHGAPDGGACFADGEGWIYVSNAELPLWMGGASAIRFDAAGEIVDAYRILSGTWRNCAGGATPWETWLSCEETDRGYVYETDPFGERVGERRPAMGRFTHEAAACDPDRQVVYLTEDEPDGAFYRFVPDSWGDLTLGTLQVLTGDGSALAWVDVPDPQAEDEQTRDQVGTAKRFDGGEGCYYSEGICFFTTKGDNKVWIYDADRNELRLAYDDDLVEDPPLTGVDNIVGTASGDLFVAEDGGNMEICVITPDDEVSAFLRLVGHDGSEITGPAFNPAGDRLYFSSQRGTTGLGGLTFEVSGPFRTGG